MKKGIYKNIIELTKENGLYDLLNDEHSNGERNFECYLDDYSDRNIVELILMDLSRKARHHSSVIESFDFHVNPKWDKYDRGYLDWRKTTIEIL